MSQKRFVINDDDHITGDRSASVFLVEYGDYQCEFCRAAAALVLKLRKHFGEKLAFVFRNFPITAVHPKALAMACLAESQETEARFWQMNKDLLAGVKADTDALRSALKNREAMKKVDADILGGINLGVNGTPCFFINGKRYDGEHEYHAMSEYIQKKLDSELKKLKKGK